MIGRQFHHQFHGNFFDGVHRHNFSRPGACFNHHVVESLEGVVQPFEFIAQEMRWYHGCNKSGEDKETNTMSIHTTWHCTQNLLFEMNKGSRIYGNTLYTEWFSRHFLFQLRRCDPFFDYQILKKSWNWNNNYTQRRWESNQ